MVQLVLDEDVGNLHLRRRERVLHRLVGGRVPGLVERGVGELASHRLTKRREIGDADRLRELIVERRQDLLCDL